MSKPKPLYKIGNIRQCGNCEYFSAYYLIRGTFFAAADKGICQICNKEKKGTDVCLDYSKRNFSEIKAKDYVQLIQSLKEIQSNVQEIMLQLECKSKEILNHDNRFGGIK